MNGYARSLPNLGFDPAPGDVGLTRDLARRHYQVAQEVRQVLAQVDQVDLSSWQGRAGQAVQALRATFPPALRSVASTAETLQAATSHWAGQLSGFQAEADALERQAARAAEQQQALQVRQAALPPGSQVLSKDLESASAAVSAIDRQARDPHERYLEAADKNAEDIKPKSLWERTEPVRTVLEAVLAPFDIIAADHWVDALKEVAGVPAEWVAKVGEEIDGVAAVMRGGGSATEKLIEVAALIETTGDVADDVGHASVKIADGLGHDAKSAWHSVTSTIGSWF